MKQRLKPDGYRTYAEVYDEVMGDRSATIRLLESLIDQYLPGAKHLLELACGTGGIMEGLQERFQVTGLDNSAAMLRVAKSKLPHAQFIMASMADFKLAETFDVIYCVHNSLNHLHKKEDWQKTFQNIYHQLKPGGIFIFDLNTPDRMDRLASLPPGVTVAKDTLAVYRVEKSPTQAHRYIWDVKIITTYTTRPRLHHRPMRILARTVEDIMQEIGSGWVLENHTVLTSPDEDNNGRVFCTLRKFPLETSSTSQTA